MNSNHPGSGQLTSRKRRWGFIKKNLREYGMLISLVVIMLFFQVMTDGTLMQPLNLTNLILQNSYIVIMALGMLLIIVAGHIDLSVGSVAVSSAVWLPSDGRIAWHYVRRRSFAWYVGR
jgi:putative multiple sugar transport system permease protein